MLQACVSDACDGDSEDVQTNTQMSAETLNPKVCSAVEEGGNWVRLECTMSTFLQVCGHLRVNCSDNVTSAC